MAGRYAVYYAPEQGSDFERFGAAWLGRNAVTGGSVEQAELPGLSRDGLRDLTTSPRFYGFHGTLVPPMALGAKRTRQEFLDRVGELARMQEPFEMGPLTVREIGSFIALVPADQARLAGLAEAVLRGLHGYREPPLAAEKRRHLATDLSQRQKQLLEIWGYPYVLDEFRFHITLTDRVRNTNKRAKLVERISRYAVGIVGQSHPVRELCVFHQPDRQSPFVLIDRVRFGNLREL